MPENNTNKNWRYPTIQEDRIDKQAIEHVAKQLKFPEQFVKRVHDFQWRTCFNLMEQGKNVYIPGFFRVLMKVELLKSKIKILQDRKSKVLKMIDKQTEKLLVPTKEKKNCLIESRKKKIQSIITQLQEEVLNLDIQIEETYTLIMTKTNTAMSKSRTEYYIEKLDKEGLEIKENKKGKKEVKTKKK